MSKVGKGKFTGRTKAGKRSPKRDATRDATASKVGTTLPRGAVPF